LAYERHSAQIHGVSVSDGWLTINRHFTNYAIGAPNLAFENCLIVEAAAGAIRNQRISSFQTRRRAASELRAKSVL
jgi:hypothetical protein